MLQNAFLNYSRFGGSSTRGNQVANCYSFGCISVNFEMDQFSATKRSEIMSRIKGTDTSVEIRVRSLLHSLGYRFRLHAHTCRASQISCCQNKSPWFLYMDAFGTVIKACRRAGIPQTNREFWTRKIVGNIDRDKRCVRRTSGVGVEGFSRVAMSDEGALLSSRKELQRFSERTDIENPT